MKATPAMPAAAMLAVLLWSVTAIAPVLHAQNAGPDPAKPAPAMTDDGLHQMLTNMGYEPKKLTKGSSIAIKRDTWTFPLQLVLSKDATKLGINANLGTVDNPDGVAARSWKQLLIANADVDPSSFYLDKDTNRLYLHRSVDTRAIDPAYLRAQIENVCSNIKDTADVWKLGK
jgi:hypothetical protein